MASVLEIAHPLKQAVEDKTAIVGVIGLGYVGLPLVRAFVDAGYSNVRRYAGGVSDWAAAGYELESNAGATADPGLFFVSPDAYTDRRSDSPG